MHAGADEHARTEPYIVSDDDVLLGPLLIRDELVGPDVQRHREASLERSLVAELAQRMAAAEEPREVLRLCVQLTRQIAERCGDIIAAVDSAARAEPEMAEISEEGRRRHHEGTRGVAEALARAGALPGGMSVERAAQLLAVLTYNEAYFQLTRDHGMSFDDAEEWVLSAVQTLLFAQ